MFINDLIDSLKRYFLLCANDLKIFYISSSSDAETLQHARRTTNQMFLKDKKCFVWTFTRKTNKIFLSTSCIT